MSLVGTRPILQDELRQYELHHSRNNAELKQMSKLGKDCYLEVSYVHGNSRIGSHSVAGVIHRPIVMKRAGLY